MKYKGIIISTMMIGIINFIYSEGVKIEKITVISKEILSQSWLEGFSGPNSLSIDEVTGSIEIPKGLIEEGIIISEIKGSDYKTEKKKWDIQMEE